MGALRKCKEFRQNKVVWGFRRPVLHAFALSLAACPKKLEKCREMADYRGHYVQNGWICRKERGGFCKTYTRRSARAARVIPTRKRRATITPATRTGGDMFCFDANGLHHYRASRAVYEDKALRCRPLSGTIYAILHSRLGSDQTLNGQICAHPFAGFTDEGVLFLAHNGGVDCENLPHRMVDSEWAFAQILKAGGVEQALPMLKEKTKQGAALNLLCSHHLPGHSQAAALEYLNYYKTSEEGRIAYYQMVFR